MLCYVCSLQEGHGRTYRSKNLLQQNLLVLNWGWWFLRDDLINLVKMSVRTSIRPYVHPFVHTSTMKHNAATNQIVMFVKVDETFTMIWLSRSSEVRVKVTWDFQKWRFSNSISSAIFQPSKKNPMASDTTKMSKNLLGQIFEFLPSYRVTWLQTLPKNPQKFFHPIVMKLGMMLEVNETFMMIWLSRSPRSGSRSGDDLSPLFGLFFPLSYF